MPTLDLSDLQEDSGMDLDSEIPLMNPQYSHSGTQLEPSISFASIEFNRQSGKRMRTNRGNLPFDVWDNTAPNTLPPTIPAANPAPTPFFHTKPKKFNFATGPYEDSIIEHASLNPRGEAWTLPADPLPYRDPAHKGPASSACQPYNHLKPLNDFDNKERLYKQDRCYKQRNSPAQYSSSRRERKRQIAEDLAIATAVAEYEPTKHPIDVKAERERIVLSCIASSHAPRESNSERAYLDEKSWYTTCPAPVEGDADYVASSASASNYSSPTNESYLDLVCAYSHKIVDSVSRAFSFANPMPFISVSSSVPEKIIASENPPPEPPDSSVQPRDNLDYGPADSGCNLPVTNPRTVQHFGLTPQLWPTPRWIKFANSQRECSTHYADFGQVIGKVAILDSAPDTLI